MRAGIDNPGRMSNAVLLIAHAPLAQALRDAALHVLADCAPDLLAVDVQASAPPEVRMAERALAGGAQGVVAVAAPADGGSPKAP